MLSMPLVRGCSVWSDRSMLIVHYSEWVCRVFVQIWSSSDGAGRGNRTWQGKRVGLGDNGQGR